MPGGSSAGGGGQTQNVKAPKYLEDDLVYSLDRAKQLVSRGPSYGLYEGNAGDRYGNLASIWGGNPQDLAASYGMDPGEFAAGLQTGVAGLNDYDTRSIGRMNEFSESPLSGLYGQAQGTANNLMLGGIGPWGNDAARTMQYQAVDPLGDFGRAAWGNAAHTASGAYLSPDSNPYLKDTFNAAARQATDAFNTNTLPALTSQFSASGRYGSGAQQNVAGQAAEDLQRNLGDMASNLYGNAYNQERGRQEAAIGQLGNLYGTLSNVQQGAAGQLGNLGNMDASIRGNAAQMAPGLAGAQDAAMQNRIGLQSQIGGQLRGLSNQVLGAAGGNYEGRVQNPYEQGSWYSNIINGVPGGLGTTTVNQAGGGGGFNAGGAAGGALSGAMAGSMFGPWGTGIGAGLGLLGGGFF